MKLSEVKIPVHEVILNGFLRNPIESKGLVIFAHGGGTSKISPRDHLVASYLYERGFASLLFDLLTEDEEKLDATKKHLRFNIPMLAERLQEVTTWASFRGDLDAMPIGYFGVSTGAAAALMAAARTPEVVSAVVSRGGRPDLAGELQLSLVQAPTLLIVGGLDFDVLELNRNARASLSRCKSRIEIVPGATHLFSEPGTIEAAATLAGDWFEQYLEDKLVSSGPDLWHRRDLLDDHA